MSLFPLADKSDSSVQDFCETFDWVPHDTLIKDLEQYKIKRVCIKWIKTWLLDRSPNVTVNHLPAVFVAKFLHLISLSRT